MIRGLVLFVLVAAAAAGAAWLADNPGRVSLLWQGYRIETTAALLMLAVAAVAVVAALLYRFWRALWRTPGAIAGAWRERTRRKGYQALSRGMVAVAAGDAVEARRQAARAENLLEDPPLTLLLSAQTAQLNGDEDAAAAFFRKMAANRDTEFLGVRGLLTQAVKRGDDGQALELARRAWRLQPTSTWVAEELFRLLGRDGKWSEADAVLDKARSAKLLDDGLAARRQRVARYQHALGLAPADAIKRLRKVHDADPGFVPAAVTLADLLIAGGKGRKAAGVIERTWSECPHPDLLAPYWRARSAEDALARLRAAEALAERSAGHVESRLAVAAQALEAGLWGEARRYLKQAEDVSRSALSARLCRLMAALEEADGGDAATVRQWLVRASTADPDPAWVCRDCGHTTATWTAVCGHCGGFDTQDWTVPPHAPALGAPVDAGSEAALLDARAEE
jgi:HemY protein